MFMFSPFKHGFKILYRPILRHTLLKIKYTIWDVYRPDITAPVDWAWNTNWLTYYLALHVLCAVYLALPVLYVEFTCALCRVHLSIYLCFVQSSPGPEGIPGAADDPGHDGQVQQLPSQGLCACHQKWVPVLTPGITVPQQLPGFIRSFCC